MGIYVMITGKFGKKNIYVKEYRWGVAIFAMFDDRKVATNAMEVNK